MRTLVLAIVFLVAAPATARADIGLGLFLGDPTGLDIKIGLQQRSALDIVVGLSTFREGRANYAHVTYLFNLTTLHGSSVRVPLRIGLGGAVYGNSDNIGFGVRAPFELGLRFTRTPIEIYGEIALLLGLIDNVDLAGQGGIGLRFYF